MTVDRATTLDALATKADADVDALLERSAEMLDAGCGQSRRLAYFASLTNTLDAADRLRERATAAAAAAGPTP